MDEAESISSILGEGPFTRSESPATEQVETKTEAPTPELAEAKTEAKEVSRDEAGRFAKAEAPEPEKPAITKADVAAIIDERRKRQELERRLAQIEQSQPKPEKPDIFENPDAAISERVREYVAPFEQTIFDLKLELAKQRMPDFDDAAISFFTAAQNDPHLKMLADNAQDQFSFIYREGKRIKELGEFGGDITKYRDKVTAEAKLEVSKRDEQIKLLMAQVEDLKKSQLALESIPRSLNKGNESAPRSRAEADEDDLGSIARFSSSRAT